MSEVLTEIRQIVVPNPLIDQLSYTVAEVDRFIDTVPVVTTEGQIRVRMDAVTGLESRQAIEDRHAAIEELYTNSTLQEIIRSHMTDIAKVDDAEEAFMTSDDRKDTYDGTREWAKLVESLADNMAGEVNDESSQPISEALNSLRQFNATELAGLLRGPMYYTFSGLKSRDSLHLLEPRLRFRPGFSGRAALLLATELAITKTVNIPPDIQLLEFPATMCLAYSGMYAMPVGINGGRAKDHAWSRPTAYKHLRARPAASQELPSAISAVGTLDLVSAMVQQKWLLQSRGHATTLPEIIEPENFQFIATGLRNPLLALELGKWVVPNDVELGTDGKRLTFLTGPNSGGKSTLAKSIVQNQVLAQMGAPVVASRAQVAMADNIAYHIPVAPDLGDDTGRFGFELGRVRDILDEATPRSLSILDDCLDGTTHQERVAVLRNVTKAFRHLSGATLFSTHAYELVDEFEEQGEGQFLQVEFDGDKPTYRLEPGVSHTSHAEKVAAKHGFTGPQVEREIERRTK